MNERMSQINFRHAKRWMSVGDKQSALFFLKASLRWLNEPSSR